MKRFIIILVVIVSWYGNAYAACIEGNCGHGQGTYTDGHGLKYAGEWKDGKRHGQGTLIYADGRVNILTYAEGQLVERNTIQTQIAKKEPTQTQEVAKEPGCIEGDCINGQGTYIWPWGEEYLGEFKDGKKHGQGTSTLVNGSKYVGGWKDDKKHGQGIETKRQGVNSFGDKYVGEFKNGLWHGQGTRTWPHGKVDNGIWEYNRLVIQNKIIGESEFF